MQCMEGKPMEKPQLSIEFHGPNGNVFMRITLAVGLLEGEQLEKFQAAIQQATAPGAHASYEEVLSIINMYIDLVDASILRDNYVDEETQRRMDEAAIIAAVDKLNEQLETLPLAVPCGIQGLYPNFEEPDCGPQMYLSVLMDEIEQVDKELLEHSTEDLQRFRSMLLECSIALQRAGVQ